MNSIHRAIAAAAALMGALAFAPTVRAATLVQTYDFTLGGFVNGEGSIPSPMSSITGRVTLTFDPTLSYTDDTADIKIQSYTGPGGSPLGFTTLPVYKEVWIGDLANFGALYFAPGINDFIVGIFTDNPGKPRFVTCVDAAGCGAAPSTAIAAAYTLNNYPNDYWVATEGSLSAVPEPTLWAILTLGFGAVGAVLRRRQVVMAPAAPD